MSHAPPPLTLAENQCTSAYQSPPAPGSESSQFRGPNCTDGQALKMQNWR